MSKSQLNILNRLLVGPANLDSFSQDSVHALHRKGYITSPNRWNNRIWNITLIGTKSLGTVSLLKE